jgi:squalene cyclase
MRVFRQIFCLKILILLMDLLREIQTEIEAHSLSRGGWSTGSGGSAAIETTCYALMALAKDQEPVRRKAIDVLIRTQNTDGSWPAFEGDDPEGCWTTAIATITLRFTQSSMAPIGKALRWLLVNNGREGHWLWKWKFRTVDRAVQFNPDKYGWSWFSGTVSWVIPTAFSVIALRQLSACCRTEQLTARIQLGTEMLRDRACPRGGWNAGNGTVFGAALTPHIDTTAIALLALSRVVEPEVMQGLNWLRQACTECSSAYSLAWAALALSVHQDPSRDHCIQKLRRVLSSGASISNIEISSLAAIAINAVEVNINPFQLEI